MRRGRGLGAPLVHCQWTQGPKSPRWASGLDTESTSDKRVGPHTPTAALWNHVVGWGKGPTARQVTGSTLPSWVTHHSSSTRA